MHRDLKDGLIVAKATFTTSISSVRVRTLHGFPQLSVRGEEQKSRVETDAIFCERRS